MWLPLVLVAVAATTGAGKGAAVAATVRAAGADSTTREGQGFPTVELQLADRGRVRGFVKPTLSGTLQVNCFLGIPFVQKPKRFEPPEAFAAWDGTHDGTQRAQACPQGKFYPEDLERAAGSLPGEHAWARAAAVDAEDCLTVDVYAPANATAASRLPVLLFFHGGAFVRGSSISARPDFLLDHGMPLVVVSAQYRLGPLGFLAAGGTRAAGRGNAGLHDQLWALRWTQDFVSAFGGDPQHIVIGGVSAGGATSGLLYVSPKANGAIRGALLFSGCAVAPWAVDREPRRSARGVATYAGCERQAAAAAAAEEAERRGAASRNATLAAEDELVDCLREASVDALLNATWTWARVEKRERRLGMGGTIPVVDGDILPTWPEDILKNDVNFQARPIIVGITREEGLYLHVQIDAFYILANSLENDERLLREDIGEIMLNFAFIDDDLRVLGESIQRQYFREDQLGNYPIMEDGIIDFTGAAFFKGPARYMAQLSAARGGLAWLYSFDYTSQEERAKAQTEKRRARSNHGSDQVFLFPSRDETFVYGDDDRDMATRFSRMVATFVTTLQPTTAGKVEGVEWPPLTRDNDVYLGITGSGWETRRGFAQEFHATNAARAASAPSAAAAAAAAAATAAAALALLRT